MGPQEQGIRQGRNSQIPWGPDCWWKVPSLCLGEKTEKIEKSLLVLPLERRQHH